MENLEYLKKFSKITINKICKDKKIDRSNLMSGRSKKENAKIVREEIESEIAKLYIKENKENEQ